MAKQKHDQVIGVLKKISMEEQQKFDPSIYPEVHLENAYKAQFTKIAASFNKVANFSILFKWYTTARDDERMRTFFRSVCRPAFDVLGLYMLTRK